MKPKRQEKTNKTTNHPTQGPKFDLNGCRLPIEKVVPRSMSRDVWRPTFTLDSCRHCTSNSGIYSIDSSFRFE